VDDARRTVAIYGPGIPKLKGTTTNGPPVAHVPDQNVMEVPWSILLHNNPVTLTIDFVYVNKIPFLTTISRNIGWRTIAPVPNQQKGTILKELNRLIVIYKNRGLPINSIHGDNEFACIRDDIGSIHLDIAAPNTHVPEIERSNRTIKERARTLVHGLPYKRLTILFVQHLMMHVVHYLNIFPWKYGLSTELSQETIMTGSPAHDYNKLKIEFGSYVQVFDAPSPSNTPRSSTHGAIALGATVISGGAFYFLSLASGEVLSRHQWTVCPIQEEVIKRLEVLEIKDKQPLIQSTGLVVEWGQVTLNTPYMHVQDDPVDRSDSIINQSNHDLVVLTSKNNFGENSVHENPAGTVFYDDQESELEQSIQVDYDNILYENQGAEYEGEIVPEMVPEHEHDESNDTQECVNNEDEQDDEQITGVNTEDVDALVHEPHTNDNQTLEPRTENEANAEEIVDVGVGLIEGEQGATYNLRNRLMLQAPRRLLEVMDNPHSTKAYETPTTLLQSVLDHVAGSYAGENGCTDSKDMKRLVFGKVLMQMTAKAGIKLYGEKAEQAFVKRY